MRKLAVYFNNTKAGFLKEESSNSYVFSYLPEYIADNSTIPISVAFPKSQIEYRAKQLFPFFANMLPEGKNKELISRTLGVSEDDAFGLLVATANFDRIGSVNVREVL